MFGKQHKINFWTKKVLLRILGAFIFLIALVISFNQQVFIIHESKHVFVKFVFITRITNESFFSNNSVSLFKKSFNTNVSIENNFKFVIFYVDEGKF